MFVCMYASSLSAVLARTLIMCCSVRATVLSCPLNLRSRIANQCTRRDSLLRTPRLRFATLYRLPALSSRGSPPSSCFRSRSVLYLSRSPSLRTCELSPSHSRQSCIVCCTRMSSVHFVPPPRTALGTVRLRPHPRRRSEASVSLRYTEIRHYAPSRIPGDCPSSLQGA